MDIAFIKYPTDDLLRNKDYDILALQEDSAGVNAGFVWLKPLKITINIYEELERYQMTHPSQADQDALITIVQKYQNNDKDFKLLLLNINQYANSVHYFIERHRLFGDTALPYLECIVAHDNYMVSVEAKVYRFKEMHMRMVDKDKYYSCPNRKYLTYENNNSPGFNTSSSEGLISRGKANSRSNNSLPYEMP